MIVAWMVSIEDEEQIGIVLLNLFLTDLAQSVLKKMIRCKKVRLFRLKEVMLCRPAQTNNHLFM